MGKKGSWFSAIKRVFIHSSKDKLVDESVKKSAKEKKKKGLGKLKHGDSFLPLFREPSSIEKILGEAEQEHHRIDFSPLNTYEQSRTPSFLPSRASTPVDDVTSPWVPTPSMAASPPRISSSRGATPQRVASPLKPSMSQSMVSSPKGATPPKSAALQRTVSPQRRDAPQRTVSPQRRAAPQDVVSSSQAAASFNSAAPPKSTSSRFVHRARPEPTIRYQHICATRIQAAYRGYMARRSYRALRGLVRLQEVVKGPSVKRQTVNAMKCMQVLVRVQTQIQSRRIQMLENQALQRQALYKIGKDFESNIGKRNLGQVSENGNPDEWDDSMLSKDEIEVRTQKKFEAFIKRERTRAYAYSHQWKPTAKTCQAPLMDIRSSGGFPRWWNWLDRQTNPFTTPTKPSQTQPTNNLHSAPPRPAMTSPLAPHSSNYSQQNLTFDNLDASATPRSTRSAALPSRMNLSPIPPSRVPSNSKLTRPRPTNVSPFSAHLKDDDSLTSCPPFSVPRYMEPTLSAKAKLKGGFGVSPEAQSKRRVSFPLAQGIGSFKWSERGSLFSTTTTPDRETGSKRVLEKQQSPQSIGDFSVDSTVSMPATVGRKPFNRFV